MKCAIAIDDAAVRKFCDKWQISKLSLFGSALRGDFTPESDIDLLVEFQESAEWSLFDHVAMQDELAEIFGRRVDLISKRGLDRSKNETRRNEILSTATMIYQAKASA